jgi:hypothetical protein
VVGKIMTIDQLIKDISAADVDVKKFASATIEDASIREAIIHLLLTHPNIMVYYHCYTILDQATLERPDLFYSHWDDFVPLLDHKNSYHRDIGMTLLANLTKVDTQSRFELIFDRYFAHLNDPKFMTAVNCLQNSQKIVRFKPNLADRILLLFLRSDAFTTYPIKQKELIKSYILTFFDANSEIFGNPPEVLEFIHSCTMSISPKTRSLAKHLAKKLKSTTLT